MTMRSVYSRSALLALFWVLLAGPAYSATNCATPPSGLVAWWPGEGNANDIVGFLNGTPLATSFATGEVRQAFSFDGVQSVVSNAVSGLTNFQNSYSIEFWAWPLAGR